MKVPILLMAMVLIFLMAGALVADSPPNNIIENSRPSDIQITNSDAFKEVDFDNLWERSTVDDPLVWRFAVGVLRSRVLKSTKNKIYWERCGVKVPEEDLVDEAMIWATETVEAFERVEKETGVKLNVWGAFATMANEGGFNECSLNYAARLWAARHEGRELITETWKGKTVKRKVTKFVVEKFRQSYDRDTVWRILHHEDYAKAKVQVVDRKGVLKWVKLRNKFDGGVWQLRQSVKTLSRERFDDLTSLVPGIWLGAEEMARRAIWHKTVYREKRVHPRPWMMWPGFRITLARKIEYDRKITSIARWLGATKAEIHLTKLD